MVDSYERDDFPSLQDWLYCTRMTNLVWMDETEEDGPDNEEAADRLRRRVGSQKCIAAAAFRKFARRVTRTDHPLHDAIAQVLPAGTSIRIRYAQHNRQMIPATQQLSLS